MNEWVIEDIFITYFILYIYKNYFEWLTIYYKYILNNYTIWKTN